MAEGEPPPDHPTADGHPGSDSSAVSSPPPPPVPSADPRLQHLQSPENHAPSPLLAAQADDIFKVSPQAALRLLSAGIEALVDMTGDIPPTPPPKSPTIPHMRGMEAEKKSIVRSNSDKNLARLAQQRSATNSPLPGRSPLQNVQSAAAQDAPQQQQQQQQQQPIDGVKLRTPHPAPCTPPPPPPPSSDGPRPAPLAPYIVVGANSQPLNQQHSAITRRFYCRVPPPISITDYLLRVHHYCPMSTAVYLAASLYIHRLAVRERAIVVTRRNAHRLLLAGLRVAMKALEDLSYPHGRFARVGGVSERELARLEISFCFLAGFELAVGVPVLAGHWELLRRGTECWNVLDGGMMQEQEQRTETETETEMGAVPFVQLEKPPSGSGNVKAQA